MGMLLVKGKACNGVDSHARFEMLKGADEAWLLVYHFLICVGLASHVS